MFQKRPTIHPDAGTVLSSVKGSDTADHPSNVLGAKSFKSIAYNPGGPQKRVVVTKGGPAAPVGGKSMPVRSTGGSAPQRSFSK